MVARPVLGDDSRPRWRACLFRYSRALAASGGEPEPSRLYHGWLINDTGVIVGIPTWVCGGTALFSDISDLKPIVEQMLAGRSGVDRYTAEGQRLVFAPIAQNGWAIAVEADEGDVLRVVAQTRTIIVSTFVVALLIG